MATKTSGIATEYELAAVIASIAEKHGFNCYSKRINQYMIDSPEDFYIRPIVRVNNNNKVTFEYSLSRQLKKGELIKLYEDSGKALEFAKEIEGVECKYIPSEDYLNEHPSDWILNNGDEKALEIYSERILQKFISENEYRIKHLEKDVTDSKAVIQAQQSELSELQNSGKNNKKTRKRIAELTESIQNLTKDIERIPSRIKRGQEKINLLRDKLQKVEKVLKKLKGEWDANAEIGDCIDDYFVSKDAVDAAAEVEEVNAKNAIVTEEVPAESEEKVYTLEEVQAILEQKITKYGFEFEYWNTDLSRIKGLPQIKFGDKSHVSLRLRSDYELVNGVLIYTVEVRAGINLICDHTPAEMLKVADEITRAAHLAAEIEALNLKFVKVETEKKAA